MNVQLAVQGALEETGRSLAAMSVEEAEGDRDGGYLPLAKGMLYLKLKDSQVVEQYVCGGVLGVSLLMSEFEGDFICLNANYVVRFPVDLFGRQDFLICQKTFFRKWTGWHEKRENGNVIDVVYVTEYGEVYHMKRSCAYLNLSVQNIAMDELAGKRNISGAIYKKCESCGDKGSAKKEVYITDYGDRYHFSVDCSGLKRIIYQKKFSEVGGMPACMKCSK